MHRRTRSLGWTESNPRQRADQPGRELLQPGAVRAGRGLPSRRRPRADRSGV